MKINQFEANEVVFYHAITTGDTITLELTQVTENIPKTVYPVIQTITNNWFKCQFTSITGGTENLTGGTIFLKYDGYYDYKLKKNGTTIEDSQFFMIGPVPTIIENQTQNTTVINNPLSGSSGTSGSNGAAGQTGAAGSSGSSGANGLDASGSSGSSGQTGAAGSSGSSGQTGVAGSSGSSASSGLTGSSGSSGSSGAQGPQGISAGQMYYFNQSQNSDVSPYKVLSPTPNGVQQTVTKTLTGSQQNVLVQEFLTPELGFATIPGGTQRFNMHFLKQASNDQIQAYVTIQLANSAGVGIGPILSSGNSEIGWVDNATPAELATDLTLSTITIDPTNRMIVKIYVSNNDSSSHNITWYTEGTGYYSFVVTSVGVTYSTSGSSGSSGSAGSSGASPGLDDLYATFAAYPSGNFARGFNFKSYGNTTPESGEYYQLSNDGPLSTTLGMGASASNYGMVTFTHAWLNNIPSFTGIALSRTGAGPTAHRLRMAVYTTGYDIGEAKTAFGYTVSEGNNGLVFNSGTYPTISGDTVSWSTTIAPYTACFPIPKNLVFYTDILDTTAAGIYKPGIYHPDGTPATTTPITLPYNGQYIIMIEATDNSAVTWNYTSTLGVAQAFRPGRVLVDTRNFYRFGVDRRFAHQSLGFSLTVADMTTYTPPTAINPTYFYQSVAGSTTAGLTNTRTNPPTIWIKI